MDVRTPVRKLMSTDPISVQQDAPVSEVRKLLRLHSFHHIPVVSKRGSLVGVLSTTDLALFSLDAWVGDVSTVDAELDESFTLTEIMTLEPITVSPSTKVRKAAEILADGGFHSLPVVDDEGLLVGMITTTDILRFFARQSN